MASIENGDGKEVDHSEIDAEDGHEKRQAQKASPCLFSSHLGDQNGTSDRLSRNHPLDQFDNSDQGQLDPLIGLNKTIPQGDQRVDLLDENITRVGDTDHKGRYLFSEKVFHGRRFWGDPDLERLAIAFYPEHQFLSLATADDSREVLPFLYFLAIDGEDEISLFEACHLRGKTRVDLSNFWWGVGNTEEVDRGEENDGEKEVEEGACADDQCPFPYWLVFEGGAGETPFRLLLRCLTRPF